MAEGFLHNLDESYEWYFANVWRLRLALRCSYSWSSFYKILQSITLGIGLLLARLGWQHLWLSQPCKVYPLLYQASVSKTCRLVLFLFYLNPAMIWWTDNKLCTWRVVWAYRHACLLEEEVRTISRTLRQAFNFLLLDVFAIELNLFPSP